MIEEKKRIVVALDVDDDRLAMQLCTQLRDHVGMFKVGSELFTAAGPSVVRNILDVGCRVFLDLKFHDIPNTVARAAAQAVRMGVTLFNVHALGGSEMMTAAAEAVRREADRTGLAAPKLLAVTVLTSSNQATLAECGIATDVETQVRRLADLAYRSGLDGAVASPHEIRIIRETIPDKKFIVLTPGVRPAGLGHQDQKRVMTPAEAVGAGADYVVIGRPITAAPDPVDAARTILMEITSRSPQRS